ncbi:hypothetical protein WJX73_010913 [Symbiochloris irregularis]|uniref:glutamate--tRNA ligase n=1 Tax=Symbiochloris irregularis TaxID=706552 RepID=A0AAW1PHJ6_9CHLO
MWRRSATMLRCHHSQCIAFGRLHTLRLPQQLFSSGVSQRSRSVQPDQRSGRLFTPFAAVHAAEASPATASQQAGSNGAATKQEVRVRFAPSPTGNLHIGGARTALFNWLIAKKYGGKMILRVEDTDQSRSTIESEQALRRDLEWLGITCDEEPGPDKDSPDKGDNGPYRQSQRLHIYDKYVDLLEQQDKVYKDFCTDEELEQMREEAKANHSAPIYTGKWAKASKDEVQEMLDKGAPFCYRARVPLDKEIVIDDLVRGPITFKCDTLGDFVVKRSNGMPVYNFAVAVDDHLMKITHVLRAEEHLPNTQRQVIIHDYLFKADEPRAAFGHVSLILGPNQKKLSKRDGATSVGEFKELGYLPEALIDYLSQLGWNDGTEQEFHSVEELKEQFSIERMIKSPAVFDLNKLNNTNSHYLRQMPREQLHKLFGEQWVKSGLLNKADSPFVHSAVDLLHTSVGVLGECNQRLKDCLDYPLEETLKSEDGQIFMHVEVAREILEAAESGKLHDVLQNGHDTYAAWVKEEDGDVKDKGSFVTLDERLERLRTQLKEREG